MKPMVHELPSPPIGIPHLVYKSSQIHDGELELDQPGLFIPSMQASQE